MLCVTTGVLEGENILKTKYTLTIDDDIIVNTVSLKPFILENIKSGEKTIASVIAKELNRNKKRVTEALNQFVEEGYFTSEQKLVKFNGGSAWSKVFTRV